MNPGIVSIMVAVTAVFAVGCSDGNAQVENRANADEPTIVKKCELLFEAGRQGGGSFPPPKTARARHKRCSDWYQRGFLDSEGKVTAAAEIAI